MAQINEQIIEIKISELVPDGDEFPLTDFITEDLCKTLRSVTTELLGESVIVEVSGVK